MAYTRTSTTNELPGPGSTRKKTMVNFLGGRQGTYLDKYTNKPRTVTLYDIPKPTNIGSSPIAQGGRALLRGAEAFGKGLGWTGEKVRQFTHELPQSMIKDTAIAGPSSYLLGNDPKFNRTEQTMFNIFGPGKYKPNTLPLSANRQPSDAKYLDKYLIDKYKSGGGSGGGGGSSWGPEAPASGIPKGGLPGATVPVKTSPLPKTGEDLLIPPKNGTLQDRINALLGKGEQDSGVDLGGLTYDEFGREFSVPDLQQMIQAQREALGITTSPEAIQGAEDERRKQIADIISADYARQSEAQTAANRQREGFAKALGYNLSGGLGTITETQGRLYQDAVDKGLSELATLDEKKQEALTKNDIEAAKRIEDRQSKLVDQINTIESNLMGRYERSDVERRGLLGEARERTEVDISAARAEADIAKSIADIQNMSRDDAQKAAMDLIEAYGSGAFTDLSDEEVRALEIRAEYPAGALMRELKTAKEKNPDLKFISASKYQKAGVFNPMTGKFTSVDEALRYSADAEAGSGLSAEEIENLKLGYLNSADKEKFLELLPSKLKTVILSDPALTALQQEKSVPTDESMVIAALSSYKRELPDSTRKQAEEDILAIGGNPESKATKAALDQLYSGEGIGSWFKNLFKKGE